MLELVMLAGVVVGLIVQSFVGTGYAGAVIATVFLIAGLIITATTTPSPADQKTPAGTGPAADPSSRKPWYVGAPNVRSGILALLATLAVAASSVMRLISSHHVSGWWIAVAAASAVLVGAATISLVWNVKHQHLLPELAGPAEAYYPQLWRTAGGLRPWLNEEQNQPPTIQNNRLEYVYEPLGAE